ncbi:unnamed protein product, partial [Tetraodon nigroviridis]
FWPEGRGGPPAVHGRSTCIARDDGGLIPLHNACS